MAGATRAVLRMVTPPKPDIPQAAPVAPPPPAPAAPVQMAQEAQKQTVETKTAELDAKADSEAASKRARFGRQAGRGLLLNDELGLPKTLGA